MKELIMAKCSITIKGNLGSDVETKFSKSGKPYSKLNVASTPSKKNEAGEWENGETMWFSVTVFAELNPFEFKKGAPVEVQGTFTARTYKKKDGTQGLSLDVAANDVILVQREKVEKKEFAPAAVVPAGWVAVADDAPF